MYLTPFKSPRKAGLAWVLLVSNDHFQRVVRVISFVDRSGTLLVVIHAHFRCYMTKKSVSSHHLSFLLIIVIVRNVFSPLIGPHLASKSPWNITILSLTLRQNHGRVSPSTFSFTFSQRVQVWVFLQGNSMQVDSDVLDLTGYEVKMWTFLFGIILVLPKFMGMLYFVGWIIWKWAYVNKMAWCNELISKEKKIYIPLVIRSIIFRNADFTKYP